MKSIVFVESNFTGIDAIRSAASAGYKCYLVTSDYRMLRSMLPHDIFDGFESCVEVLRANNSDDQDELIEIVHRIGASISAVITFSQFRILTVAKVAKRLGLPGTNPEAISVALNKLTVRQVMKDAGLPSVNFVSRSKMSLKDEVIEKVSLPCIFKPLRGHSSLGIRLARTPTELEDALSKTLTEDTLIEEYLEGPLFSLETVTTSLGVHRAWGYSDRLLTDDFIEMGATFPALPPDFQAGCDLVFATLDAIGFDFGTCHTELIFTKLGPRIVEINPRPGGSGICRLVQHATQSDVVLEVVQMYLGESTQRNLTESQPVTMRSVLPPCSGRIYELPSKVEILSQPGVKDAWFQRKIGELTDDTRSNFSWVLTILAVGSDGKTSVENADAAAKIATDRIKIVSSNSLINRNIG